MQYFIVLAEELHFGRAAERLYMTQPPLSQQISKLEEELGVILLDRIGHKVILTDAGKIFLERAQKILALVNETIEHMNDIAKKNTENITIGIPHFFVLNLIPLDIISNLVSHLNNQIKFFEIISEEQIKALIEGKIDMGIIRSNFLYNLCKKRGINCLLFHQEPINIVLPKEHRLSVLSRLSILQIRELINEPFIIPVPSHSLLKAKHLTPYKITLMLCKKAGFKPKLIFESVKISSVPTMVKLGKGVSIVPASLQKIKEEGVSFLPIENLDIMLNTSLVWLNKNNLKFVEQAVKIIPNGQVS